MRFRRNPLFEQQIGRTPQLQAGMRQITVGVAAAVREHAPNETGYYRRRVRPHDTLVIAGDPFSHLIEWGSVNNPPYAPIRLGVRTAGLRLDELLT